MNTILGNVYWLNLEGIAHPYVVIQFVNEAQIIVCALTTNAKKARLPGNIVLAAGEANLEKTSIVEVSKQYTVNLTDLNAPVGRLSEARLTEIAAGNEFIRKTYF